MQTRCIQVLLESPIIWFDTESVSYFCSMLKSRIKVGKTVNCCPSVRTQMLGNTFVTTLIFKCEQPRQHKLVITDVYLYTFLFLISGDESVSRENIPYLSDYKEHLKIL